MIRTIILVTGLACLVITLFCLFMMFTNPDAGVMILPAIFAGMITYVLISVWSGLSKDARRRKQMSMLPPAPGSKL